MVYAPPRLDLREDYELRGSYGRSYGLLGCAAGITGGTPKSHCGQKQKMHCEDTSSMDTTASMFISQEESRPSDFFAQLSALCQQIFSCQNAISWAVSRKQLDSSTFLSSPFIMCRVLLMVIPCLDISTVIYYS